MSTPEHRRARSLDLGDSVGWMETCQQSRQQLFENTAKFNHTQPLPPLQKPQRVQSLFVSHNANKDADSILISTTKCIPPADEIDAADTSSSTTKRTSSAFASDKFHVANASPLTNQNSRPTTPISKLIQRFTSEMLNYEIPSPKLQSQSFVKESLKFKPTDDTSWTSTAASSTVFPSVFQSNAIMHDAAKLAATTVPFKTPNVVQPTSSVQQSKTECNDITLRRPSFFWGRTNSAEPMLQCSLITQTGISNRTVSLHMPQTFRPPEWAKLPATGVDQTDAGSSWIQISSSTNVKTAGCSSQPTSVAQQHLTRASSFHSYPVTERSLSCVYPTSSESTGQPIQPNKAPDITSPYKTTNSRIFVSKWDSPNKPEDSNSNFHRCSQVVRRCSTSSLTSFPRQSKMRSIPVKSLVKKFSATSVDQTDAGSTWIQISSSSNVKTAGCSSQPTSVAQQHLKRASSFHSYPVTERSLSCVYPTSSESTGQPIQPNKAPDITSPYKTTNSRIFVSKWDSPNKPEDSNSNFHRCSQVVRRCSTSSLTSFPRRSKMPSIPVKSLVKKFSANN
ncbi:cell wall protein RBR3-like [Cryptotermes secundus]|uniref:cell wall protein RBR3-like n=1 Tax=Cryptotermes secundus TaxID=105785 RepID=UPI000CD7C801|nr:cell wall protein RBR3-like [Cryptotermes secundus]